MKYIITGLITFTLLLTACKNRKPNNYGDLFNVYAIVNGIVTLQGTEEPVKGANVYFNIIGMGPECQKQYLANPDKYDSTKTNSTGNFSARLIFINLKGPICIEAYATLEETMNSSSDTVQFTTELNREAPFDTTNIKISINP